MNPPPLAALLVVELLLLLAAVLPLPAVVASSSSSSQPLCDAAGSDDDPYACIVPPEHKSLPDDFVDPCQDSEPRCPEWAVEGECRENSNYMLTNCARSCGSCIPMGREHDDDGSSWAPEDPEGKLCGDDYGECGEWASEGECFVNPSFMQARCKYSCWKCVNARRDRQLGVDEDIIAKKLLYVKMDPGKNQLIRDVAPDGGSDGGDPMTAEDHEGVVSALRRMDRYHRFEMTESSKTPKARERCQNSFRMCAEWASRGMCLPYGAKRTANKNSNNGEYEYDDEYGNMLFDENNRANRDDAVYMMNVCPLACRMCEEVEDFHRCTGRRHPRSRPSFASGDDLDSFLGRKLREDDGGDGGDWAGYGPIFASHPDAWEGGSHDDPYVVILKEFLDDGEADHLRSLGSAVGGGDGGSARCHDDDRCAADSVYRGIMARIASLLDVTTSHLEPMEMVRFRPGGNPGPKGALRHNFDVSSMWKPAGPRILSLFMFLSDVAGGDDDDDGGGELGFPHLDWLKIRPRKGMAVMWMNVRNDDFMEPEPLTSFEHFPLQNEGESLFGASVHVMLYNWTDANIRGCA